MKRNRWIGLACSFGSGTASECSLSTQLTASAHSCHPRYRTSPWLRAYSKQFRTTQPRQTSLASLVLALLGRTGRGQPCSWRNPTSYFLRSAHHHHLQMPLLSAPVTSTGQYDAVVSSLLNTCLATESRKIRSFSGFFVICFSCDSCFR